MHLNAKALKNKALTLHRLFTKAVMTSVRLHSSVVVSNYLWHHIRNTTAGGLHLNISKHILNYVNLIKAAMNKCKYKN